MRNLHRYDIVNLVAQIDNMRNLCRLSICATTNIVNLHRLSQLQSNKKIYGLTYPTRPLQSNQNTVEQSRTESNRVESGRTKSNKVELQQFISVRLCDCVRLCSTVFTSKVEPKSNQSRTKNGANDGDIDTHEHSRTQSNTVEHSQTQLNTVEHSRTQSQSRTATIFFGSTLFDFVRLCSTLFDFVRLCSTVFWFDCRGPLSYHAFCVTSMIYNFFLMAD